MKELTGDEKIAILEKATKMKFQHSYAEMTNEARLEVERSYNELPKPKAAELGAALMADEQKKAKADAYEKSVAAKAKADAEKAAADKAEADALAAEAAAAKETNTPQAAPATEVQS